MWWDMHRLRAFCLDVHPGTVVTSISAMAQTHGLDEGQLRHHDIYDDHAGSWQLLVPAPSTMGDMVCAIHHDKNLVLSAAIEGP
jgi:hypothetical protein